MRLVRRGIVAVAVAALAGCGSSGHGNARRDAVNAYFDRVDHAEAGLVSSSGEIDRAFSGFKLNGNTATEVHELRFARARIGTALARVRSLRPPRDARRIHAELVALLTLQHAAAVELLQMVTYQPQLTRALAPLRSAGNALADDIRQAAKAKQGPTPISSTEKRGAAVWGAAGCGGCHTLTAVGSTGKTGPNLDVLQLSPDQVAAQVRTGGGGMPAFAKRLTPANIDALATFVSAAEAREAANTSTLAAYATAFERYRTSLDGILRALDGLNAPPVLRPSYEGEVRTLRRAAALSGTVAAALTRRDIAAANRAIRHLFASAAAADQTATRDAAAAAVRIYNRRLKRIAMLTARVTRERQRLVRQVG